LTFDEVHGAGFLRMDYSPSVIADPSKGTSFLQPRGDTTIEHLQRRLDYLNGVSGGSFQLAWVLSGLAVRIFPGQQAPRSTCAGAVRPDAGGLSPWYMLTGSQDAILQNVSFMSRAFMGISIRCAQCHNHFQNKQWTQSTVNGLGKVLFCQRPGDCALSEAHGGDGAAQVYFYTARGKGRFREGLSTGCGGLCEASC